MQENMIHIFFRQVNPKCTQSSVSGLDVLNSNLIFLLFRAMFSRENVFYAYLIRLPKFQFYEVLLVLLGFVFNAFWRECLRLRPTRIFGHLGKIFVFFQNSVKLRGITGGTIGIISVALRARKSQKKMEMYSFAGQCTDKCVNSGAFEFICPDSR